MRPGEQTGAHSRTTALGSSPRITAVFSRMIRIYTQLRPNRGECLIASKSTLSSPLPSARHSSLSWRHANACKVSVRAPSEPVWNILGHAGRPEIFLILFRSYRSSREFSGHAVTTYSTIRMAISSSASLDSTYLGLSRLLNSTGIHFQSVR